MVDLAGVRRWTARGVSADALRMAHEPSWTTSLGDVISAPRVHRTAPVRRPDFPHEMRFVHTNGGFLHPSVLTDTRVQYKSPVVVRGPLDLVVAPDARSVRVDELPHRGQIAAQLLVLLRLLVDLVARVEHR